MNDKPTNGQYLLAVLAGLILAAILLFVLGNIAHGLAALADQVK